MGVNFSAFEIGRRALTASQLGLTIAGQNIANVNTPGYTRQSVQLSASPAFGSNLGLVGNGVTIDGVRQFRDRFVDARLQTETGIAGRLTAQRDALWPVNGVFDESSGNGISTAMNGFFNSFSALEANPSSLPLRADVIAKANLLSSSFASTRANLVRVRDDANQALAATVTNVNELAKQIADLNVRISTTENSGMAASELRDQRGELARQLTEATGARSVEDAYGMVTLTVADGRTLVAGAHASQLQTATTSPDGILSVELNGEPVAMVDGELKGFQNAISIIGGEIASLDDLAAAIANRVNALHTTGTDLNGAAGTNFFNVPASGPITAANLSVSAAVQADSKLIVASPLTAPSTAATVAGAIGSLLDDPTSVVGTRTGSFSSVYSWIVAEAGQEIRSIEDSLATQQAILSQAIAQRDAVSGVSLDEEAVNLLQFQRAYEAAARFLKIADEMTQAIMALGS